jgi:hypothetical protein
VSSPPGPHAATCHLSRSLLRAGWSSWNGNGGPTTPANIRATAERLEKLGLRALGYNHVDIDGAWYPFVKDGPPPDPRPAGGWKPGGWDMKALADDLHAAGFKLGLCAHLLPPALSSN